MAYRRGFHWRQCFSPVSAATRRPLSDQGLLRNYEPHPGLDQEPSGIEHEQDAQDLPDELACISEAGLPQLDMLLAGQDEAELARLTAEFFRFGSVIQARQSEAGSPAYMRALAVGATSRLLMQNITDVAIQPVIQDQDAALFVASVIGEAAEERKPRIITADVAQVGVDLNSVPLDEVLDFRRQHASEYTAYARDVRQFVLSMSLLSDDDQLASLADRKADLEEPADNLRRIGRRAFNRSSLGLGFGLVGAAWTVAHGDPSGGAFAAGAAAAGFAQPGLPSIGAAYTYILRAARELSI